MRTRYKILILIGLMLFPVLLSGNFAYGLCVSGTDWDKVPCWGRRCAGDEPACTDPNWWKQRWMPYYDYKGAEWMNQKKTELLDAIKTNTLAEWKNLTPNGTNSNVHDYYFYMGQVPSIYGVYVDQFFADSFPPLKQIKAGMKLDELFCKSNFVLLLKHDGSPACVKPESVPKLIERGWAENSSSKTSESNESSDVGLQVHVTGQQQVRRGTTHDITVDVTRDGNPVFDSLVIITIEDYGKDIIREFKGKTDDSGRFVFSWEIPKSFDDIETLLAYVDVTDDISAKTVLFKFQVYCLPGEPGCKVEGN